jgi:Concanavalin A-like lectin/glucanases superfamily
MKLLKILLAFLFQMLISQVAIAQINVVYVNGIQNTITGADDTRIIIRDILNRSSNHVTNRLAFTVTNVWNPMGWTGGDEGQDLKQDLKELFLLKTAEENFATDFAQLVRPNNDKTSLDRTVAARVNTFVDDMTPGNNTLESSGGITDANMTPTRQTILNLVTRIRAVADRGDGKTIVIAHSQGNLIANLAYARLASEGGYDAPNKLRIINIANTSEFSVSGLNFTHAGDAAIFSAATVIPLDQSLETLPSQGANWNRTTPRCVNASCNFTVAPATFNAPSTDIPDQSSVDKILDHSIVETYLSTANLALRIEQGVAFTPNTTRFIDRFEDFVYAAAAQLPSSTTPSLSINFDPGSQTLLGAANYQNVTFISGLNGRYAAKFGGVSSPGYIRIPNQSGMQFTDGATFDFYARMDSMVGMDGNGYTVSNGAYAMTLIAKSHDRSGISFLANSMTNSSSSIWSASFDSSMNGSCSHVPHTPVALGTWVRITYTMSATDGIRGYLNKNLIWQCTGARPNFATMNANDLYIGKFSDYWYPLNGAIQDIRIYKKALTSTEIQSIQ